MSLGILRRSNCIHVAFLVYIQHMDGMAMCTGVFIKWLRVSSQHVSLTVWLPVYMCEVWTCTCYDTRFRSWSCTLAPVVKPVGQISIFVEWTASGDISSYSIVYQITLGSSPAMTAGPISCSGRCNYTLTGLTPEAVYTVTVVGVGGQQLVTSGLQVSVGSGMGGDMHALLWFLCSCLK